MFGDLLGAAGVDDAVPRDADEVGHPRVAGPGVEVAGGVIAGPDPVESGVDERLSLDLCLAIVSKYGDYLE